jgi:hypothetical protein
VRYLSGLAAAGLLGVLASAGTMQAETTGKSKKAEVCTTDGCGKFGTSVQFVESPSEAARQALKAEKLVLVLHVSGDFENPDFT